MAFVSKKTFNFQEDPNAIVRSDFNSERCEEYADDMSKEKLIQYIINEMKNFQQDRIQDVSALASPLRPASPLRGSPSCLNDAPLLNFKRALKLKHIFCSTDGS